MNDPHAGAGDTDEIRLQTLSETQAIRGILQLLNSSSDLHTVMREVTRLLREWSGCEAVGIRLRNGQDFPYFETRGFPQAFVLAENSLCARDSEGHLLLDQEGNPCLECMCGNVICARIDPAKPFFSSGGSFWTNSTSKLLASTSEADRQARTRNRCNGEGYESVALIPLRSGGNTLGLLQFNDRRPDRFTPELIAFLEVLGNNLALCMAHRQATAAVHKLALEWQTTFDAVGEALWLCDEEGRVLCANRASESFLGVHACRAVGRRCCELVHQRSEPPPCCPLERMRKSLRRETVEMEIGDRWCRVAVDPVLDDAGGLRGAVHAVLDISERKAGEAERARLREQLYQVQKLDAVGEVAAGIAHDFGNILTVMEGQLYIAVNERFSNKERREAFCTMGQAVTDAKLITRTLSTFSRGAPAEMELCDLREVVTEIEPLLRHSVGCGVRLTIDLPAQPMPVRCSRVQLHQVLVNLSINARDAMRGDGVVRIACEPGEHPGLVRLVVSDTGEGMEPETLARAFEPFFTTKQRGKGTGLGLAIVHGIITAHAGSIDMSSEPNQGTRVTIALPTLEQGTAVTERSPNNSEAFSC